MAISITSPQSGKYGWIVNATSVDASGCEEIKAAPAAGLAVVVDHVTLNCGSSALSLTLGAGETGGSVTAALIGPISMAANSSLQWDFPGGMALDDATALVVDASGAGPVCVFAYGRII